jgi:hypothetical protein
MHNVGAWRRVGLPQCVGAVISLLACGGYLLACEGSGHTTYCSLLLLLLSPALHSPVRLHSRMCTCCTYLALFADPPPFPQGCFGLVIGPAFMAM